MTLRSLSYFDKNRIERALDQVAETGMAVRVVMMWEGKPIRVLVSRQLDHAKIAAERSATDS